MRAISLVNILLAVIAVILAVNLIIPKGTMTGEITSSFEAGEKSCTFYNLDKQSEIPIDLCCIELQKQLGCEALSEQELRCFASRDSERYYVISSGTFYYCRREGYNVRMA